jgi:hypothetical protein
MPLAYALFIGPHFVYFNSTFFLQTSPCTIKSKLFTGTDLYFIHILIP